MPRSAKQNAEIRAATYQTILQTAMTLFAERGYAHTSTRRIAQTAGISTGLMYHYFANKDMLLRAVFDQCMATISQAMFDAMLKSPPKERLPNLLRATFGLLAEDRVFWSLFYALRAQPAIMQILGNDVRLWTEQLRRLLVDELARSGRDNPPLDALLLYSLIEGTMQQYLLNPDIYPLNHVVERIIQDYCLPTEN